MLVGVLDTGPWFRIFHLLTSTPLAIHLLILALTGFSKVLSRVPSRRWISTLERDADDEALCSFGWTNPYDFICFVLSWHIHLHSLDVRANRDFVVSSWAS